MIKPLIVGITGGSGSGKTTFLKAIAEPFQDNQLTIISQDDYYKPREEQIVDENGVTNFDLPTCIDVEAFYKDVSQLIKGESVNKIEYTFNNEKAKPEQITFNPAPILIIEGLFIFHYEKIKALFDLKIFVESDDVRKVVRRIKRDQIERNYPLDDVLYRYEHHVLPSYDKFIKPYKKEADIVVNNYEQMDRAIEMVSGYLQHKAAVYDK